LTELPFILHAFTLRAAADTKADGYEESVAGAFGYRQFARAEQTHGNGVAIVTGSGAVPVVDALVTNVTGLLLMVRCADCAPVFLVDRQSPAIGLIHSGKRGTLANVTGAAIAAMTRAFGTTPGNLRAFIGPSIGPCHYDMDIWSSIIAQLRAAGVGDIHHPRRCTACDLGRYYSYRAEQGRTGRHFALLALR
jgi:YfiH family protein